MTQGSHCCLHLLGPACFCLHLGSDALAINVHLSWPALHVRAGMLQTWQAMLARCPREPETRHHITCGVCYLVGARRIVATSSAEFTESVLGCTDRRDGGPGAALWADAHAGRALRAPAGSGRRVRLCRLVRPFIEDLFVIARLVRHACDDVRAPDVLIRAPFQKSQGRPGSRLCSSTCCHGPADAAQLSDFMHSLPNVSPD